MGRTYWFECSRCGYRTAVCGGGDSGKDFAVLTVICRDCKALYDAVVKCRVAQRPAPSGFFHLKPFPRMEDLLGCLSAAGLHSWHWVSFPARCPVSGTHHVNPWQHPGKCPRCGVYLDKNVLPFRLWD